jgi:K+-sensing histidine kinase KdpD
LTDVLRGAQAEIESFARVRVDRIPPKARVAGPVVFDLVYLVAELLDNATAFSPPHSTVFVVAQGVTGHLAIMIRDRGIGIPPEQLAELNDRLARPIAPPSGGAMGIYVVSCLAARQGIGVQLRAAADGGVVAEVRIPSSLLV